MNEYLSHCVVEALSLSLWLALPALAASALAGLVSGLVQSATQVQDPALGFVPRLFAVAGALFLSASFMQARLLAFAHELFGALARLAS